jgi:hypothetical protein
MATPEATALYAFSIILLRRGNAGRLPARYDEWRNGGYNRTMPCLP